MSNPMWLTDADKDRPYDDFVLGFKMQGYAESDCKILADCCWKLLHGDAPAIEKARGE